MIPLYDSDSAKAYDKYAIEKLGIPGIVLMENAAINIFNAILEEFSDELNDKSRFAIICGKGNNGLDGFALARHLINYGFSVTIISIGGEKLFKSEEKLNFQIVQNMAAKNSNLRLEFFDSLKTLNKIRSFEFIIDAMLGTGSKGNLREPYSSIVNYLNKLIGYKIAIDVPTGLNIEKGTGECIFNCDLTVTLALHKFGLYYNKGKINSGKVVYCGIGAGKLPLTDCNTDHYLIEPEDAMQGLPIRKIDDQKFSVGKVLTFSGSLNFPGAPVFATNSILKSGAGASKLAVPKSVGMLIGNKLNGSTLILQKGNADYLDINEIYNINKDIDWADCVLIGPGLGREDKTVESIINIINLRPKNMVIDADAIFAIRNNVYKKLNISNYVLTPHHKEFADLIDISIDKLENDIINYGKTFALENNVYLVLKGAPTIIFSKNGEIFVNSSGNPGMAKFGSGDVLSGILSGFIAQNKFLEKSIISGVYLHSLSADLLVKEKTELSILAEDIIENFPNAIRFLIDSIL